MIISRNISEEKLLGNVSENATSKVILHQDGLLVSVGVVMLLENMISIILLWKSTRLLFQIRILSLNLAISDFLTGFFLALPNTLFYEKYQCDIKKYPCFLFVNVSLLIVTMMNLDRCFVFAFAIRYYLFITKNIIMIVCALAWIFGIFLTYGMFFDHDANLGFSCELMAFSTKNKINTIFRCILIRFVFLNLIMFGYLLHKIRKCVYQVQHTHIPQVPQRPSRVVRKKALLVGIFLAAYFPFVVIYTFPVFDMTSQLGRNIYTFTASFVLLNSACNPVLYVWRFSEPRYHMKKLLCCWNKQRLRTIDQKYNQEFASFDIYTRRK